MNFARKARWTETAGQPSLPVDEATGRLLQRSASFPSNAPLL